MAYAKGGAAAAHVEASYGDLDGPIGAAQIDPSDVSGIDEVLTGYVVGGGVAFAVTDTVSLNAEYNFIDLEDVQSSNLDGDLYEMTNEVHLLKLGVSARF
jgi:opacity protein-like surface antigen